jgi:hypothetical protein
MTKYTRKNMRKKRRGNKKTRMKRYSKGGEPIGSGGYGCVFFPEIGCRSESKSTKSVPMISKLMTKEHAKEEFDFIKKFLPMLRKIKNFKKYFLVSQLKLCNNVAPLTPNDLEGFDKSCTTFKQNESPITQSNVNERIHELATIQMPYGGHDVSDYISHMKNTNEVIYLTEALNDLLIKAILPMNAVGIYHMDIKPGNILVSQGPIVKKQQSLTCSLIDWGLAVTLPATILNPDGSISTEVYRAHQFIFNSPFSIVLLNDEFVGKYNAFIKETPNAIVTQKKNFLYNFIISWLVKKASPHMNYILHDLVLVYGDCDTEWKPEYLILIQNIRNNNVNKYPGLTSEQVEKFRKWSQVFYHIVNYWMPILESYSKKGTFDVKAYFKEIFVYNVDVYGWLTCFSKLLGVLPEEQKQHLRDILKKYMYNPDRIDVKELIREL